MAGHGHHHHHHHGHTSSYAEQNYEPGAKWIKSLTQGRLSTFTGGHFGDVNLSSVLFTHRLDDEEHVKLEVWSAPGRTKPGFDEAIQQKFKPGKKGDSFGPSWTNHWWKVTVTIPSDWVQYERVQFEFDPGCEAMIFTTDGTPLQGITGGYGGDRRVEYIIPRHARKAGKHEFVIESSCNGMFGVPWDGDSISPPDMNRYFSLASADLVVPNQEAWGLLWDFTTLRELADTLPGNSALQNQAISVGNEIMNIFNRADHSSIARGRKIAEQVLSKGWERKGSAIYDEGDKPPQVWGIGYCHIDTAWLWPYSVTQQKVARSWATQIDLMERYPEHRFTCSSAQQFKWLEQLYPKLFDRVAEKVKTGQFQLIGGSWVENDANMPSGEALIRQFTYGQRYFQSRFGKRSYTAWLPDSFGLTGAYPQIMRGAGMENFFTQKLSWNNINVFPHSTFNWVGIDGSQVLCHMTPVDTYTAQATAGDLNKAVVNHKNLESSDVSLLVFGNGDGGGGPLPKMLENLRRLRGTGNQSREVPLVHMGRSTEDFFEFIMKKSNAGKTLPNWHGELYLEFHRGTYTSHGSIKKGNRKSEFLLRDTEIMCTTASLLSNLFPDTHYKYPKEVIDECWEKVLLNQFHDVLPGSAIGMVYDDAEKLYAEVAEDLRKVQRAAFPFLMPNATELTPQVLASGNIPTNGRLVGYNTLPFPRREVVAVPLHGGGSAGLRSQVVQTSKDGSVGYALLETTTGQGLTVSRGLMADCHPVSVEMKSKSHAIVRNENVKLTIEDGRITSLIDVKQERELIPQGQSGGLVIFDDKPNYWDAWDVEIHHLETAEPIKFENLSLVSEGPLRGAVMSEFRYGQSLIKITISLDAVSATTAPNSRSFFRFDADIDWRERHRFLKFEIPLNIHSDVATYDTQFGYLQRPTHKNTTWDAAKFEVCGHKYADLSEFGYGVAILSESKYGFSCLGNLLRISLLRAATAPDAEQDQGKHEFSWAVHPHEGHFLSSDVIQAAYLFNVPSTLFMAPPHLLAANTKAPSPSWQVGPFRVHGAPNVIVDSFKRGDDDDFSATSGKGNFSIVVRLYEAFGGHAKGKLLVSSRLVRFISKASLTNLLEEEQETLKVEKFDEEEHAIQLPFRGFEVKTVKLDIAFPSRSLPASPPTSPSKNGAERDSWVNVGKSWTLA